MKIVEFENGRFGVRKLTLFGYKFLNMDCPHEWQRQGSAYFNQCMKNKDTAIKAMTALSKNEYKVVSEEQSK